MSEVELAENDWGITVSYSNEPMPDIMRMMSCVDMNGHFHCPRCGRYAKYDELGQLGGKFGTLDGSTVGIVSAYGHLPGFGCNKKK